jgi:hypothetical protein
MTLQIFNNIYTTLSCYSNKATEFSKPIANKIAEIAKKCFNSIGHFALGFCLGALAATCYIIFKTPPVGYVLDLEALPFHAVTGGICMGAFMAHRSWKREAV